MFNIRLICRSAMASVPLGLAPATRYTASCRRPSICGARRARIAVGRPAKFRTWFLGCVFALACRAPQAADSEEVVQAGTAAKDFAVVGYVTEERFAGFDWLGALSHTTHIILHSIECDGQGKLTDSVSRLAPMLKLRPGNRLEKALKSFPVGTPRAKLMISVGGVNRSAGFAEMASSKKYRRRFAKEVAEFVDKYPVLDGVDINWEGANYGHEMGGLGAYESHVKKWTDLQNTVALLRTELGPNATLSAIYHPLENDPSIISSLSMGRKGNKKAKSLLNMLNFMHVTAYNAPGQHSTTTLAKTAVQEWNRARLPLNKLTLGVPFFGREVKLGGAVLPWSELVTADPALKEQPTENFAKEEAVFFNNADTLRQKVHFAMRSGLAGIMIWELGQDRPASDPDSPSLLRGVTAAIQMGPASIDELKRREEEQRKREAEL